jgi:hypothetical protein
MGAVSVVSVSSPSRDTLAKLFLSDEMLVRKYNAESFGFGENFQQHNGAIAMNDVVTSHQHVCSYNPTG